MESVPQEILESLLETTTGSPAEAEECTLELEDELVEMLDNFYATNNVNMDKSQENNN